MSVTNQVAPVIGNRPRQAEDVRGVMEAMAGP